jgi:hypothetical protein
MRSNHFLCPAFVLSQLLSILDPCTSPSRKSRLPPRILSLPLLRAVNALGRVRWRSRATQQMVTAYQRVKVAFTRASFSLSTINLQPLQREVLITMVHGKQP